MEKVEDAPFSPLDRIGHTLMQTIARANRVSGYEIDGVAKRHGEIVDYYNVFRRMKKALRDYAAGPDDEDLPETYDRTTFKQKCDNVYELIVDYAMKGRKWAA